MDSRTELLAKLTEAGFMMDDIRLFLDTHPRDVRAIKAYNDYAEMYKKLENEYSRNYAGFNSYCGNMNDDMWVWNEYPMPWEGGCK